MQKKFAFLILFLLIFLYPSQSQAVIPPDFIFNIGSQVFQFFGTIVIFFSAIFALCYEFLKTKITLLKQRRILVLSGGLFILFFAVGISYYFANLKQKFEYEKWLADSKIYSSIEPISEPVPPTPDNLPPTIPATPPVEIPTSTNTNFFEENKKIGLSISNENFKTILAQEDKNFLILDARENIEFENGSFPGSTHIRFADIRDGEWKKLPTDKIIYVFCWSGIRGKEVAEFLRTKNIVGVFLEKGASGWYDFGGTWQGNIKFTQKYTDIKFQKVFSTQEVKNFVAQGAVLVDSREPEKFQRSALHGSVSLPIFFTPTSKLESTFAKIPQGSKVITVCDDYVNCFDAKVTGVELERRGYLFLGRYNKPWEYGK